MFSNDAFRKIRIINDQLHTIKLIVLSVHDELVSYRLLLKNLPKSTSPRPSRFTKYTWLLVCVICFMFQAYHMTSLYMKYEVNADYVDYAVDRVEFPAIHICIDKPFKNGCVDEECIPLLETTRIFFANVRPVEDFIPGMVVVGLDGQRMYLFGEEQDEFFAKAAIKYRFSTYLCYQIDLFKYLGGHYSRAMAANMMSPIVSMIALAEPFANWTVGHLPMFLTEPGHFPSNSGNLLSGLVISRCKVFTYKRHVLNLRPPPFITKCRDYKAEGLKSQTFCAQKCSLAMSLKNGTGVPKTIAYMEADDNPWYDHVFATSTDFKETMQKPCVEACKQLACHQVYHSSRDVAAFDFEAITAVAFQLPDEADLVVTYTPRMLLTEYLALMGSILGLWLGFSVYALTNLFDRIIC